MKELLNLGNGLLVVSQQAGVLSIVINAKAQAGGGLAAGVVSVEDSGSISLNEKQGFDLAMAILMAHSPAALVPFEKGAQAVADAAIDKI